MREIEQRYDGMFVKEGRLNFQIFQSLELDGKDLEHLNITSSTFLTGHFRNVRFYNASFFSTKLSDVSFEDCNLRSTDICSLWAKNCKFQDSDFSNATISDSTFIQCAFDGAMFRSISLTKCQFIDCSFEQFPIDDSTFSLNTFTRCQIKNTHFTESFYYQIFDDCVFHNVNMDPELLGFNFGFSSAVFAQLADGVDLNLVDADFTNKRLYINVAIFRINQIRSFYDEALVACVAALGQMVERDILIKADEIEFLKNLTSYLQERREIAPISIMRMWQLLNNLFMIDPPNTAAAKAMPHIREFANTLYFSFLDFQKELQERLTQIPPSSSINDTAELKIVYVKRPTVPLLECLVELSGIAAPSCPMPRLIRVEQGSFHEFHEIATVVIPYLQTLLTFLGVIVPITIYSKQKQDHDREKESEKASKTNSVDIKKDKSVIDITLSTASGGQSSILLPDSNNISPTTNKIILDVGKVLVSQPIADQPAFCGYNAQNIQTITIRYQ